MADEYQVYMHENLVNGKRYIGATKNTWQDRWRSKYRKSRYMGAAFAKYPDECWEHYILADGLSKNDVAIYEQLYILGYETNDRKKGYNIGHGGEGISGVDNLHFVQSQEEYHEHLSEAMKKSWASKTPEERKRCGFGAVGKEELSRRSKELWQDGKYRERVKKTYAIRRQQRENDPEYQKEREEKRLLRNERQRERSRDRYVPVDPDVAHKHRSDAAKASWESQERRDKMSSASKKRWQNDEYRSTVTEKIREARIGTEQPDSTISNISSGMTEKWKEPAFRESLTNREHKKRTDEQKKVHRDMAIASGAGRAVYCVETNTTYPSISTAAEALKVDKNRLGKVLRGKQSHFQGYHVFYAEPPKKVEKPVICVETGVIYESAKEASRQTGIGNANIGQVCNGKRKIAGGYHWKFA